MISEADRNTYFAASPMLRDFVATGLQDLQLSENDEACSDGREARDSGTIYTLCDESFLRCVALVSRFERKNAAHIATALEIEPGEPGLQYRRASRAGCSLDHAELGSTLWLAVVGSGVTFTDDGNAPCLDALADWARDVYCEGFYFGDDSEIYFLS